jgi:hypothetical protein
MNHSVKLTIADVTFEISSLRQEQFLWIKKKYGLFLTRKKPDVDIVFYPRKNRSRKRRLLSRWQGAKRVFISTAHFDLEVRFDTRTIKVFSESHAGIFDVLRFVSLLVLLQKKGALLHASGVVNKGKAYIFFGPSESGKTTITRLSAGKLVLSDETIAVRKKNGRFFAYSTPFAGEYGKADANKGAPLGAIFFIIKAKKFGHQSVPPIQALGELLSNNLISVFDRVMAEYVLGALTPLVKTVPCYRLYFKKERTIWRYIDGYIHKG